ncbi:SprT-like domain-containing protein [Fulvivirgaceae bacterium PWU4]|uniref:SprT-like domain-containing protein n=1 Tax=Chryseosolibacter histidini TaxID=2782349 RepID=A0AAP2GK50_9BACT|nr:SprT-like domain-containing protein [Chryseosolibacter histidini]MBT1698679.1 SprT-like domain-containing protein [Chryseosolibacter histidini]
MMHPEKIHQTLHQHVPGAACPYCFHLWKNTPFELKLTRSRQSKVGDFTSRKSIGHPRITLNRDLNPFLFLITYIHEVAHLHVYLKYGNRVDPHGEEWKSAFKQLMVPTLQKEVFPEEILHELGRHMVNPKASSFADADLTRVLRSFDKHADQYTALSDIPEGSIFQFQGRYFRKGKLKRTRVLCHEIKTRRNYLVPAEVLVSNVQLSML